MRLGIIYFGFHFHFNFYFIGFHLNNCLYMYVDITLIILLLYMRRLRACLSTLKYRSIFFLIKNVLFYNFFEVNYYKSVSYSLFDKKIRFYFWKNKILYNFFQKWIPVFKNEFLFSKNKANQTTTIYIYVLFEIQRPFWQATKKHNYHLIYKIMCRLALTYDFSTKYLFIFQYLTYYRSIWLNL